MQWVLRHQDQEKSSFSCSYGNWIPTLSYIFCFSSCLPFLLILFHLPLPYITGGYNVKNCIKDKWRKLGNLYCTWHVGVLYKGIFIERKTSSWLLPFHHRIGWFLRYKYSCFLPSFVFKVKVHLLKTSKLKAYTSEVKRPSQNQI